VTIARRNAGQAVTRRTLRRGWPEG
jgi:hypothetical protein